MVGQLIISPTVYVNDKTDEHPTVTSAIEYQVPTSSPNVNFKIFTVRLGPEAADSSDEP